MKEKKELFYVGKIRPVALLCGSFSCPLADQKKLEQSYMKIFVLCPFQFPFLDELIIFKQGFDVGQFHPVALSLCHFSC